MKTTGSEEKKSMIGFKNNFKELLRTKRNKDSFSTIFVRKETKLLY